MLSRRAKRVLDNHKITCCIPRHTLRRARYFFHRDKLRIRRTRQVDLSCYKIKQVPFLLFSCSSLFHWRGSNPNFLFQQSAFQTLGLCFCSFKIPWNSVELIFFASNLANIKARFCFFTGLYFSHLC